VTKSRAEPPGGKNVCPKTPVGNRRLCLSPVCSVGKLRDRRRNIEGTIHRGEGTFLGRRKRGTLRPVRRTRKGKKKGKYGTRFNKTEGRGTVSDRQRPRRVRVGSNRAPPAVLDRPQGKKRGRIQKKDLKKKKKHDTMKEKKSGGRAYGIRGTKKWVV